MDKTKMLALLKNWGVTVPENSTDDQLIALVNTGPKPAVPVILPVNDGPAIVDDLQKQINNLTTANTEAKRVRLTSEVKRLITEDRLPAALEADTITDLMRDETRLEKFYNRLPAKPPGAEPIGALLESGVELIGEALDSIQKFVNANTGEFMGKFIGKNTETYAREDDYGRARIRREMANRAKNAARAISKSTSPANRAKILAAWNTNSIDAGLQRQVIFTDFIEEYAITLLPFETFCKKYDNVPLEGTDEVDVPFYPRSSATAQSWDPATGYAAGSFSGTTLNTRPIKVGATATADSGSNAAAGTAKDRKWVGLQFSSNELRRQPYENWEQHAKLQANVLAVAITSDVISRVVCAANFGASAKAVAASLFTPGDIADLTETANGLYWPTFGRWLVLDHTYLTPLLKDATFKQYLSYGSTDPIRKAQIKEAYGFENILIVPNLSNYAPAGETLKGWINHESGVLLATAPVMPTEDVMALLSRYDLIAHPSNNMVLEHRRFADLTLDLSKWTVECSYGAEKGRASSLQRITES